jgi:hypothetical protein
MFKKRMKYEAKVDDSIHCHSIFLLSKMYLTFIRPLLEYASEVWDGSTCQETDLLKKIQLHTARIVTGLSIISRKNHCTNVFRNWLGALVKQEKIT